MVSSEKATFVWSVSVVIFVVGVRSSNLTGLSTNQNSSDGSLVETIEKVDVVLKGSAVESNETCDCGFGSLKCKWENGTKVCDCWSTYYQDNGICIACNCGQNSFGCSLQNGQKICSCSTNYADSNGTCKKKCREWVNLPGECVNGGECRNSVCQCLSGTHGDRCEIIDGCDDKWLEILKCGDTNDVKCAFNQTSRTSFCKCNKFRHLFDTYDKTCKECDCGEHGTCSIYAGQRKCECEKGYSDWYGMECKPCDCGMYGTGCKFPDRKGKECTCEYGYVQWGNECAECTCGNNGVCSVDKFGYRVCKCYFGYAEKDGYCAPCDCGTWGKCKFSAYGKQECYCNAGYGLKDGICTECSCYWNYDSKINCTYPNGEHKCTCPKGYEERNPYFCSDIDECEDKNICPFYSECQNTPGSYECTCKKGYRPFNGMDETDVKRYGCKDIDECVENNDCPYRDTSKCINTLGSYYCECKDGYYTKFSKSSIEFEGCQEDQTGWRTAYMFLITALVFIISGLIFTLWKRRNSS